jgi:hypothetical protein
MHTTQRPAVAIGLVALALLSACAQSAGSPAAEDPSASRRQPVPLRSADAVASSDGAAGGVPDSVLSALLADAVERTGADEGDVTVARSQAMTWSDGSLGCPEPDMSYTQALVDGYHVVLEVAGEMLDYRVGSGSDFRLCESPLEGGG